MVLSTKLLSSLVRQSAINANVASRLTTDLYKKPFVCRLDLIQEIVNRYKVIHWLFIYLLLVFVEALERSTDDFDFRICIIRQKGHYRNLYQACLQVNLVLPRNLLSRP
jgi:hypothetical protein